MKNEIIKSILITIVMYLFGCVISAAFNPFLWVTPCRFWTALIWVFLLFITWLDTDFTKPPKKT